MECLIDYIGLKICGDESSASGLFINSLPGISLESIDNIANADQITFAGVWRDVQIEAASRFFVDFINEVTKCYTLQPYCDYEAIICDNKARLAVAWKYLLGSQIMQFRLYTTRLNRFTTVDLKDADKLNAMYTFEYEKALALAARIVDVSSCQACCSGNPETVTWLP